ATSRPSTGRASMLDILTYPFMQRALIGGILVGLLASYYGPIVIQRNMAFLGSGLAHAAFGGIALGIMLRVEPLYIAAPYTVAVAIAIVWVSRNSKLSTDTLIGVFFAASMALGMVFLALAPGYGGDPMAFLFGDLLAVTHADIAASIAVVIAT